MRVFYFFLLCFINSIYSYSQITSFISIENLAKNKQIELELKSLGGYQGNCVQIDIENLTNTDLHIWLEAGRRLDNTDDKQQDIIVLKEQQFNLNKNTSTTITAFGFCCQSSNGSPAVDKKFTIGFMETGNLLWIAQYLNEHPLENGIMQSAVWVFSNAKNPASILGLKDKKVLELKKAIAQRLNIEIPWYEIYYEKDSVMAFSDRHYNLKGLVEYNLPSRGWFNMAVRGPQRQVIYKFTMTSFVEGGHYHYDVDLNIKNWPKGKYEIEICLDDILKKKIGFTV